VNVKGGEAPSVPVSAVNSAFTMMVYRMSVGVMEGIVTHELITLVLALAGVRVGTMLIGLVGYEIWTRRGRH
jgi:hypothetical protein